MKWGGMLRGEDGGREDVTGLGEGRLGVGGRGTGGEGQGTGQG